MVPVKRTIHTHPALAKKVISGPPSDPTVDVNVDVQSPAPLAATPIDPLQAVDYVGTPIKVGDVVDVYSCKVVGLRADSDNRLNVLAVPFFNNIVTPDPNNPLTDQEDNKAVLFSGYNCTVIFSPTATGAERSAGIDAGLALKAARDANPPTPITLPSNFLAPSLE